MAEVSYIGNKYIAVIKKVRYAHGGHGGHGGLCPVVPHLSEKGYISKSTENIKLSNFLLLDDVNLANHF